jgi:hypothetical protein
MKEKENPFTNIEATLEYDKEAISLKKRNLL